MLGQVETKPLKQHCHLKVRNVVAPNEHPDLYKKTAFTWVVPY